jgi:hypothetical protein
MRTVKGAYFRLLEDKSRGDEVVEYRSGEKLEALIVDGESYGQFSVFVFVLKDRGAVRNYVDRSHPVVITLNGQNHGEMTSNLVVERGCKSWRYLCANLKINVVEVRMN